MTTPIFYESRTCLECGRTYSGYGATFCGRACNLAHKNRVNNPSKTASVRAKLSAAAKASGRQAQLMTPEARSKAIVEISKTLKGKTLTAAHRAAIGRGSKMAGCIPPRNPHLIGPNRPNWKGGHRAARQADYKNPLYVAFRDAVKLRDNWTCQDCQDKGEKVGIQVHHIKSWGAHPDLRYEVSNGITLCRRCHKSRHRGVPRPVTVGPRTLAELRSSRT